MGPEESKRSRPAGHPVHHPAERPLSEPLAQPQRRGVLCPGLGEPALAVVRRGHALAPPLVSRLVRQEEAGQVAEVRRILGERARAQRRRAQLKVDEPRRAVAARGLALRHHEAESRVGRRAELLGVERQHLLRDEHLVQGLAAHPRAGETADGLLALLPQAHVGEPPHDRGHELARLLETVLGPRAAALGAERNELSPGDSQPVCRRVDPHPCGGEVLVRRAGVPRGAVRVDERGPVDESVLEVDVGATDLHELLVDGGGVVATRVACGQA